MNRQFTPNWLTDEKWNYYLKNEPEKVQEVMSSHMELMYRAGTLANRLKDKWRQATWIGGILGIVSFLFLSLNSATVGWVSTQLGVEVSPFIKGPAFLSLPSIFGIISLLLGIAGLFLGKWIREKTSKRYIFSRHTTNFLRNVSQSFRLADKKLRFTVDEFDKACQIAFEEVEKIILPDIELPKSWSNSDFLGIKEGNFLLFGGDNGIMTLGAKMLQAAAKSKAKYHKGDATQEGATTGHWSFISSLLNIAGHGVSAILPGLGAALRGSSGQITSLLKDRGLEESSIRNNSAGILMGLIARQLALTPPEGDEVAAKSFQGAIVSFIMGQWNENLEWYRHHCAATKVKGSNKLEKVFTPSRWEGILAVDFD